MRYGVISIILLAALFMAQALMGKTMQGGSTSVLQGKGNIAPVVPGGGAVIRQDSFYVIRQDGTHILRQP